MRRRRGEGVSISMGESYEVVTKVLRGGVADVVRQGEKEASLRGRWAT